MIRTERLVLRQFRPDDFEMFRALIMDKMASPWAPYDAQWPTDEAKLRTMLERFSISDYWYAMDLGVDIIGFIVAQPSPDGRSRDIGYTVRTDMQRKGFAYEACAALLREYAKDSNLAKFTAGTAECNHPSRNLLHKLGFVPVTMHRAWFKKDENDMPMWFLGYSYECSPEIWRN